MTSSSNSSQALVLQDESCGQNYSSFLLLSDEWNFLSPVLMENGSLMKVESIAECSKGEHSAILFDLHLVIIGIENQCLVFFLSGRLRQVLLSIV